MQFTLHQLKVYSTVVEKRSITKASEELNLTQPGVSVQLKNFQDQFDIPLYEVIGRQIYITDFGMEIHEIIQEVFFRVDGIKYKSNAFKGLLSGKLKISVVSTGNYVMPYFLNNFLKKHSEIDLTLDVANKTKVIEHLEKNEVDFALVTVTPEHLEVNEAPIMTNKLVLVASKDNLVSQEKVLDKSFFKDTPLIFREEGSGTRHTMQQFFKKEKIKPQVKLELSTNEAIIQAVIADIGISIVSLLGIKNELFQNELQIIPVKGLPLESEWKLIWLKKKLLSPVAQAFLDYVESERDNVYNTYFSWMEAY